MATDGWTIGELAARVAAALGDGYPGAPNGRVRDLPDARAIRWYATIGLVDRPSAMRGRTALYGPRHLLQLVAIKRRQAQGRTIAQIQQELTGAGEATIREIAQVPEAHLSPVTERDSTERDSTERDSTTAAPSRPAAAGPTARAARFWAARAAPPRPAEGDDHPCAPPPTAVAGAHDPGLLTGVPLPGGAVLLLPATPDPDDLTAIAVAARPLLDLLSARGLLRSES